MTPAPDWILTECRGRAGLRSLEADWRRLYARMPRRTNLIAFEAVAGHLDHCLEDPDAVRCLALGDGRDVRAICLLEPRTERRLGFGIPVWGGIWLSGQAIYSDLVCPDEEVRRVFVPLLAEHLRRHPMGRRLLALGPLEGDASLWEGLRGLDPRDLCADPDERMKILDSRRPFAQVEAGCTRRYRRALRNTRNRLAELPDVRFRTVSGARDLAAEVPVFLDLEASGWKGKGGSAIRQRRGLADWYAGMAAAMEGEQDHCEIYALDTAGRCIASTFSIRTGPTRSLMKIAYDETHARFSPGHHLLAHVIELCCADPAIERVNFVSDAPWLTGWPTELLGLRTVYVNIGGWIGRLFTTLLRFRLGPVRRRIRGLQSRLRRFGLRAGEA
jgi:hypothetical protein